MHSHCCYWQWSTITNHQCLQFEERWAWGCNEILGAEISTILLSLKMTPLLNSLHRTADVSTMAWMRLEVVSSVWRGECSFLKTPQIPTTCFTLNSEIGQFIKWCLPALVSSCHFLEKWGVLWMNLKCGQLDKTIAIYIIVLAVTGSEHVFHLPGGTVVVALDE